MLCRENRRGAEISIVELYSCYLDPDPAEDLNTEPDPVPDSVFFFTLIQLLNKIKNG